MKYDQFGQCHCTEDELADLLYQDPNLDISRFLVEDPEQYNQSVKDLWADLPELKKYQPLSDLGMDLERFDSQNQANWYMPEEYQQLDIAQHILDLCKTEEELQRVGQELLLYHERNLFNLLRYLKYFVDTMRANGVVWGLGRGSSTASYVLYLLKVHRIDSLYYDLPIEEFLK
jgi:DNA polymerase III alpha subunit